ncbi:MAG: quinolinate synthase NadA, partial [Hyphomonadaceae bacterium]|nr:quinolinate synthase NadA [Hyphomonadaceae bacterium]
PDVEFVKPCNLCPHMKQISLADIYDALLHGQHEVLVPDDVSARARKAVEAMLNLPKMPANIYDVARPVPASMELI